MRAVTPVTTAIAAGGYVAVVATIDPFRASVVQCPVHAITGWWCPGCGSTRAVHALLEGDLGLSLAAHPMVLPVIGLLAYLWIRWAITGTSAAIRLPRAVPLGLAGAFVVLTVARNLGVIAGPPLLA